jgi:hypothetical protein
MTTGLERAVALGRQSLDRLDALGVVHDVDDAAAIIARRSSFTGAQPNGAVSAGDACRILAVADGWIAASLPRPDDLELLPAWVGIVAEGDAPPWGQIAGVIRGGSAASIVERGQELGLAVAAVAGDEPDEPDEQLRARGTVDAGRPYVRTIVGPSVEPRALAGCHVVDLSSLWAGPLCARFLGGAGARVTKVESTTRPDGSRLGNAEFHRWLHDGHDELAIPFSTTEGRAELRALLASADVVIEGSRPRALDRLGIDPRDIVASGSGMVWVAITAYGRTGPWCNRVGFGDDAAAAGGLIEHSSAGVPEFVGDAIADPLTGMMAAALVAGAVRDGGGVVLDVALREVARAAALEAEVEW